MKKSAPPAPSQKPAAAPLTIGGGARPSERAVGWALAAAAGLYLGACEKADEKPSGSKSAASTGSEEKNCCHGKNACKGQGGCAVPGKHECAGKNACKGQGGCNMHCPK